MEPSSFDEQDGARSTDWRLIPLIATLSWAWLCAASLLWPVVGLVADLRSRGVKSGAGGRLNG